MLFMVKNRWPSELDDPGRKLGVTIQLDFLNHGGNENHGDFLFQEEVELGCEKWR